MKKITAGLLAALLLCASLLLTGCGHIGDEEEIVTAAVDLFERVEILNQVYFGSGIPTVSGTGTYREADPDWLEGKPFNSLSSLKELTRSVYSDNMYDLLLDTILTSPSAEEDFVNDKRYDEYKIADGYVILVNTAFKPLLSYEGEGALRVDNHYDLSSIRVKEQSIGPNRAAILVDIEVVVTYEDGTVVRRVQKDVEMKLSYEKGVWLVDDYTCYNYIPE